MSARVTDAEVREIITVGASVATTPFIAAANLTVTDKLGDSAELSSDQLKEIERWLAAHFLAISLARQKSREKIGSGDASYTGTFGQALDSTTYGQTAKMLDTTGTLARLGLKGVVFEAVPHNEDEEEGITTNG